MTLTLVPTEPGNRTARSGDLTETGCWQVEDEQGTRLGEFWRVAGSTSWLGRPVNKALWGASFDLPGSAAGYEFMCRTRKEVLAAFETWQELEPKRQILKDVVLHCLSWIERLEEEHYSYVAVTADLPPLILSIQHNETVRPHLGTMRKPGWHGVVSLSQPHRMLCVYDCADLAEAVGLLLNEIRRPMSAVEIDQMDRLARLHQPSLIKLHGSLARHVQAPQQTARP